jgi:hypothetical protein
LWSELPPPISDLNLNPAVETVSPRKANFRG